MANQEFLVDVEFRIFAKDWDEANKIASNMQSSLEFWVKDHCENRSTDEVSIAEVEEF